MLPADLKGNQVQSGCINADVRTEKNTDGKSQG